jgi:murein DD-endopeptidase MepM/ murein hydrolase activator NlpD
MDYNKKLKKIAICAVCAMTVIPTYGQDLLARQAPVDRKMKAVDTLALQEIVAREEIETPAAQLYDDWNNKYAHKATKLPSHYRIDLRHFCMPTRSRVVTSNFGSRWGRQHKGLDIKVYIGDTIRAAFSGKVRIVKYDGNGYGKYIVIRHNNGLETIYGHLSKQIVEENQVVRAGDPIGLGGNTGRSTGSHLHFETRLCGVALNPALMFDFRNQDVTGDFYTFNEDTYTDESVEATALRGKIGNGGYTRDLIYGVLGSSENSSAISKQTNNPYGNEVRYHKVKSGETIVTIAHKRGVSVEQIIRLNHLGKNQSVRPGQILRYS